MPQNKQVEKTQPFEKILTGMATKYGSFQIKWFKIFGHSLSIFNHTPFPGFLEPKGYHWTLGLRVKKGIPSSTL
jgi:hypothetical protein